MNLTELYSTRIQKTFDDDLAEIVDIFKANPKKVVKLINYYKGMPLSYPATIVSIDRGAVDMDVQGEQAFAIEKNAAVFIRSPLFKHDIFAKLQYVNVKKKAATFNRFCYVEVMAERRNFIRIEPDQLPTTAIESPQGIIEGNLSDISLAGIGVMIHESCPLEVGVETQIRFTLKTIDQSFIVNVSVPARLITISGDVLPRIYRFNITPDKSLEQQLSQYIFKRQVEIIGDIKDAVS